jgi:sugar phosphate isomerase/epimerase
VIGCNFDPSHLFWQGIDPLEAVEALGEAIYHVHAKDTRITPRNARVNGVLDPTPYAEPAGRGWNYRTVGYGHDALFWKAFVSALREVGYDDVLSIEHEDAFISTESALAQAQDFLASMIASSTDAQA